MLEMQVECSVCGPKDISNFYKNKSGKYGVRSKCKDCMKEEKTQKIKEENDIILRALTQAIKEGIL